MNHANIVTRMEQEVTNMKVMHSIAPSLPYIIGEGNSITQGGVDGLSNQFAASLWTLDYILAAASRGIRRVVFHNGVDALYTAWQPVDSSKGAKGTRAPYYGLISAAAMIAKNKNLQIVNARTQNPYHSVYGAYSNGKLVRLAILNMKEYAGDGAARGAAQFTVTIGSDGEWTALRLKANDSRDKTNMSFNGWKYDYPGKPVKEAGWVKETIKTSGGKLTVTLPDTEAIILYV